jgi:maltose alpha-D-glucosyltransferase/alpha-amylase
MTTSPENGYFPDDPLWYKDAIFYELRVRSLYDSNGDGVGDFPGLTAKLDYFRELGVTTLWLLPFYPSPMRDDGYDIADYLDVHPDCGTLENFKVFLKEAHRRGLRVVTELVLNHTSDQHPWFQKARRAAPGTTARDFYVWSDTAERYKEARIIFKDFEHSNWAWDPVAKAYYWHRFYSHQPDLNFDSPAVREALLKVVDFWFALGVDGLRLDAVPYLYEREGTNCENLPETHAFLRDLRRHVDERWKNRMLLAEANQWPEDAVAYLDHGKSSHMAFHFPIMPRMFMSVRTEDRFPLTDMWAQTPDIGEGSQWGLFLRNHDELTLEMVTDEERDYMYRAYAHEKRMRINLGIRRRLAPLLGNNRRTIELMNALLFSLPGTPFIYYGDEIGMGDNVYLGDRDGVRTPMQWSGDRNAGFSVANPQRLILPVIIDHEYHYQTVNVEGQEQNRHSLLWWMRRLIALRKQWKAFGRGTIDFLHPENPRVLAFIRSYQGEHILVVANLSRFVQSVELDLSRFKGAVPIELFGRTPLPAVGDRPYFLTLGSHVFYWFALGQAEGAHGFEPAYQPPKLELGISWKDILLGESRDLLEGMIPHYLLHCGWFGGKDRNIKAVKLVENLPIGDGVDGPCLNVIEIDYDEGEPDQYLLPLSFLRDDAAHQVKERAPERIIAELKLVERGIPMNGIVCDSFGDLDFARQLLDFVERQRVAQGTVGQIEGAPAPAYREVRGPAHVPCEPRVIKPETANSSVVYGERLMLKLYRKFEEGINPDLEVGRFLTEHGFAHSPTLLGAIEYSKAQAEPKTLAVVQAFIPNQGDAWSYTREELRRYYERAAAKRERAVVPDRHLVDLLSEDEPSQGVADMIGAYLEAARLLGRRTAELHLVLASGQEPDFAVEPYGTLYQRSMYQSMRNNTGRVFRLLKAKSASLPESAKVHAETLQRQHDRILELFDVFLKRKVAAVRMRCHGDLHLGQVLYTGKDFLIIDFEGDAERPLSEKRRKRSGLRDVASMLRSFHYAALSSLIDLLHGGALGENAFAAMEPFAAQWQTWCSWAYLKEYMATAGDASFVSADRTELRILLDAFQVEKALLEAAHEIERRPEWLAIPVHGIEQIFRAGPLHGG